jgi:hypothetical protein
MLALERWYYQFVRLTAKFKVGIMFTIVVNPDSCAEIRSSCLVKTTESNYLARSY